MNRTGTEGTLTALLSIGLFQLIAPLSLRAQAWLPARGEGNLTLTYQNLFVRNHLDASGKRFNAGHIRAWGFVQDFEYGLTDKLALSLSLPYTFSRYYGPRPHIPSKNPRIDDGTYHSTFQDFRVGVRRNFRTHPLVLTPFVEVLIPSHNYESFAHSAVGSDLKEFRVGINAGRRLDPILPRAYFQTRYSIAVTERTIGIRPFRERLESQFGYFVNKRLSLSALENLQVTHHGVNIPDITRQTFPFHDKILDINLLSVGLGASLAVTDSVEVFASGLTSVWGRNGHTFHDGLSFGINWNFRTRRYRRQALNRIGSGQAFAGDGTATPKCDSVVCRKCQKIFEPPDSAEPAIIPSMVAGR